MDLHGGTGWVDNLPVLIAKKCRVQYCGVGRNGGPRYLTQNSVTKYYKQFREPEYDENGKIKYEFMIMKNWL